MAARRRRAQRRVRASNETQVQKQASWFADGVENVWKSMTTETTTTHAATLFVIATNLCSLLNMDIAQAGYLSAAIAGGKPILGTIQDMVKKDIGT